MYKLSNYNIYMRNEMWIYNSVSNILAEFSLLEWKEINILKNSMKLLSAKHIGSNVLYNNLLINGFVVKASTDEFKLICNKFDERINLLYNTGQIQITLLPTSSCNMRCPYCFEGDSYKGTFMSKETEYSIVKFVDSVIKSPITKEPIEHVSVMFFGGEPLLNMKSISRITKDITDLCVLNKIKYSFHMTTNGTLLSPKFWEKIRALNINKVQITIDGNKEIHNHKRPLKSGSDYNYDRILDNLKEIPKNIKVNIRINSDKEVIQSLEKLLHDLVQKEIWPNYVDRLKLTLGMKYYTKESKEPKSYFLNNREFYEANEKFKDLQLDFYNEWAKRNNKPMAKRKFLYPNKIDFCYTARHPYGITIDPNGNIYKCWMRLNDPQNAVQNICEPFDINLAGYAKWLYYKKYHTNTKCIKCKLLPICDKDCIKQQIDGDVQCTVWKYILRKRLKTQLELMKIAPDCIVLDTKSVVVTNK